MIIKEIVDEQGNVIREEVIEEKSPFMRYSEAAAYWGVSVWTIEQWVARGLLTRYRAPGLQANRLRREDVLNLFQPDKDEATKSE